MNFHKKKFPQKMCQTKSEFHPMKIREISLQRRASMHLKVTQCNKKKIFQQGISFYFVQKNLSQKEKQKVNLTEIF